MCDRLSSLAWSWALPLVTSVGNPRSPSEGACALPAGAVAGGFCGAGAGLLFVCAKDGNEAAHKHAQVSATVFRRIVFTLIFYSPAPSAPPAHPTLKTASRLADRPYLTRRFEGQPGYENSGAFTGSQLPNRVCTRMERGKFSMSLSRLALAGIVAAGSVAFSQTGSQAPGRPDHMEHRFDNPEASAQSFDDPARDAWQMPDRVIATLGLKPGQTVADIGAGTGYFSVRLARSPAAPEVYAADIEPAMVKYLQDRAAREGLKNVVAVLAAADTPNLPEPVDVALRSEEHTSELQSL